jgi:periplasmic divalent cation tolerance protein
VASEVVLIFATLGSRDEAERAGEKLVEMRLAACGSIIPTVHSFYFWEGRMRRNHEALLLLKTTAEKVEEIQDFIQGETAYDLPEVLVVAVESGLPQYLAWLLKEVREGEPRGSASC